MQCFKDALHSSFQPTARSLPQPLALAANLLLISLLLALTACAQFGRGEDPSAINDEPEYLLYPPPPSDSKIQFLASYNSEVDIIPARSGFATFIKGSPVGTNIIKPYGVAIYDGSIFVCDPKNNAVLIFDLKNQSFKLLGSEGNGKLLTPINIAIDEDGTRYVADGEHAKVIIFNSDNKFIGSLNEPEDTTGELNPWAVGGVKIDEDHIYVSDVDNGRVLVFDKESHKLRRTIGEEGLGEDKLFMPTSVDVDSSGNIYVGDTGHARVVKFDKRGRFIRQFGSMGQNIGSFVRPKGIALDRDRNLYVVDSAFENVQIFNDEGELLLFFGGPGGQPGALNLPAQIFIDYDNIDVFADFVAPGYELEHLILITSQYGDHKVNVFGRLKESNGSD